MVRRTFFDTMLCALALSGAWILAAESETDLNRARVDRVASIEKQPLLREIVPQCVLIVQCRAEQVEDRVLNKVVSVWHGAYDPQSFARQPRPGYLEETSRVPGKLVVGSESILFYKSPAAPKQLIEHHALAVAIHDGEVSYPTERQDANGLIVETQKFTVKEFEREVKLLIDDRPASETPAPARTTKSASPKPVTVNLGGQWKLLLPAGFEWPVTFTEIGENRYRLEPGKLNLSGIYELRGKRLVLVQPPGKDKTHFEWQLRSGYMATLVEQSSNAGNDYLGAVLFRAK